MLSLFSMPSRYFNARTSDSSEETEATTGGFTVWTGLQGQHWLDLANWTKGLPSQENHAFIPRQPEGHHFPVISTHCEINFTLKNEGLLIIQGQLIIMEDGFLQNDGLVDNAEGGRINNFGRINNYGTLINQGFIDNQHVLINGNTIENQGSILGENQIIDLQHLEAKVDSAEKMFQMLSKQQVS
ncbi:MAG: hypothetical protein AAF985_17630 [Bacteroidota bacterium]